MATYTLVKVRKVEGASYIAYRGFYKRNPNDKKELPQTIVRFGENALEELNQCKTIEAEVVTVPLNGTYEYPNGLRIQETQTFCPITTDENGNKIFAKGYDPREIAAKRMSYMKYVSSAHAPNPNNQ